MDDSWSSFTADLSAVLGPYSGRSLAAKSFWGRTTVAEIKSGQRRPTQRQLSDILSAAGVTGEAQDRWVERYLTLCRGADAPDPTSPAADWDGCASDPVGRAVADSGGSAADRQRRVRPLVFIGVAGGIAAAAVSTILVADRQQTPSAATTPTSHSASTVPGSTTDPRGTIDSPLDQTSVSSSHGVKLRGSAAGLQTGTLWLVDRDPDGVYTADTSADMVGPRSWTAEDAPVGDPSDLPGRIDILLIWADDACATYLRRKISAKDSSFEDLPEGCSVLDRVTVSIDRP